MAVDGSGPLRDEHVVVGGRYEASPSTLSDGERDDLRLTSAGLLRVAVEGGTGSTVIAVGGVAHDSADSGNPIKIGGKGSAAVASAVTEGDRVNASFTLEGRLRTESSGAVAHDAADSGNPVKIGARAVADNALVAAMTANDRSDLLTDLNGRLRTVASQPAASWSATHNPGANTQATISKAADAAARHVCKGFMFSFASLGAPTPEQIAIVIRDGATGAGTIIWQGIMSLPAVAGESKYVAMSGLYLVGTINTAMTAEFAAAGGANDYQVVSIFGESIPA